MFYEAPRFAPLGDCYLNLEFGDEASLEVNFKVLALGQAIEEAAIPGVIEVCPTISGLAVILDREQTTHSVVQAAMEELLQEQQTLTELASRVIDVPTWYGDPWTVQAALDHGVRPNLEVVAEANGLTVEETIRRHSSVDYWTALIGFTPGQNESYPLDQTAAMTAPKYESPRTDTPTRAIGCAGTGTCIYPFPSPGGYQLLGISAIDTYDPYPWSSQIPANGVLLRSGDRLRFRPIGQEEYQEIRARFDDQTYVYDIVEETIELDILRST